MTDKELIAAYAKEMNITFSRNDEHRRYRDRIFQMYNNRIATDKKFRDLAQNQKSLHLKDPQYDERISGNFKFFK